MTLYLNEDDIADLKIKEEAPYVDKIIIQESMWTHAGNLKPIRFNHKKYDNKVTHLVIENDIIYKNCDLNIDRFCRASAERRYPLSQFPIADDDVILVTDIDEIINGEEIPRIVSETQKRGFVRLGMRNFYYINVMQPGEWSYPYAVSGKIAKERGLDWLRLNMIGTILKNCGNHFGWLGGVEAINYKIQNMSHIEFNKPDIITNIEKRLEKLDDVVGRTDQPKLTIIDIDHKYPRSILNNFAGWKKYKL